MNKSSDVVWHHAGVTRAKRAASFAHRSMLLWFTGLSGSGKSTLAHAVEDRLHAMGRHTFVLDGDNVRHGLCGDLGFSEQDRVENIRRVGEVGKLFLEAGVITLTAFISPFCRDRAVARSLFDEGDFLEIYCRCPREVCEERDVKGLYQLAREGKIKHFTGVSSPYEAPLAPELTVDTDRMSVEEAVEMVLAMLCRRGLIGPGSEPGPGA